MPEGEAHPASCCDAGGGAFGGLARLLSLAATPVFGVMALYAGGDGICAMMPSWLGGMDTMYVLMSLFHAPPWIRLLGGMAQPIGPGVPARPCE